MDKTKIYFVKCFFNGAFAYLFRKNLKGDDLTDEEVSKVKELHDYSVEIKNTLNQLSEDVNAERLNWDELDYNPSVMFSKEINNVSKDGFKSIEENFEQGLNTLKTFMKTTLSKYPKK